MSKKPALLQPLDGDIFLFPYGCGTNQDKVSGDEARVRIQRMGGNMGYGAPPEKPWSYSPPKSPANYVLVPTIVQSAWGVLFEKGLLPNDYSDQVAGLTSVFDLPKYMKLAQTCANLIEAEETFPGLPELETFLGAVYQHFQKTGKPITPYSMERLQETWDVCLGHAIDIYRRIVLPKMATTYIPRFSLDENPSPLGSRYHGMPWVPDDIIKDLDGYQYLFQIDCDAIPEAALEKIPEARGKLLTFFVDSHKEMGHPLFLDKAAHGALRPQFQSVVDVPPGVITSWEEIPCTPDFNTLYDIFALSEDPDVQALENFMEDIMGDDARSELEQITLVPAEGSNDIRVVSISDVIDHKFTKDILYSCPEQDRLAGWPAFVQGDETPEGGRLLYQWTWNKGILFLDNGTSGQKQLLSNGPHYGRNHIYVMPDGSLTFRMACD